MSRVGNEFKSADKLVLANRANTRCSNPRCKKPTAGPASEDKSAVNLGVAAHIKGAAEGSKRYDSEMSSFERAEITNGIWLCQSCAKLIDSDERRYTVELLYKWKREHEVAIAEEMNMLDGEREMRDSLRKMFANESPLALDLAIHQPPFWEYRLTVELWKTKLKPIKRGYNELSRGLIYQRTVAMKDHTRFFEWCSNNMTDMMKVLVVFQTAINEELQMAWGEVGEAGDPEHILRSVNYIITASQALLDIDIDVSRTAWPDEVESIRPRVVATTSDILRQLETLPDTLAQKIESMLDGTFEGTLSIDLKLDSPDNITQPYLEAIETLRSLY